MDLRFRFDVDAARRLVEDDELRLQQQAFGDDHLLLIAAAQRGARIHRVGQRNPCTYIYLVTAGTVDEKVLQALRDKADLARVLIDKYWTGKNPFETP